MRVELGLARGTRSLHGHSILLSFPRLAVEISIGWPRVKTLGGQAGDLAGSSAPVVFLSVYSPILGAKCQKINCDPSTLAPTHLFLILYNSENPPNARRIEIECHTTCGKTLE